MQATDEQKDYFGGYTPINIPEPDTSVPMDSWLPLNTDDATAALPDNPHLDHLETALKAAHNSVTPLSVNDTPDKEILSVMTNGRHRSVIRLYAAGRRITEIGNLLDMTPTTIHAILSRPESRQLLATLIDNADQQLVEAMEEMKLSALDSVSVLKECLQVGHDDKIRLAAAKDILDRTGLNPTTKVLSARLTDDDLNALKTRARQALLIKRQANAIEAVAQ